MATKSYFLTATTGDGWRTIDESTQAAATNSDGWVVSTGNTNHSEFEVGVERAATTFTGTTVPDGTLDTSLKDAFRSTNALSGSFASGNWVFHFVVRGVTSASTQAGRIRFRILKANADGSSATEITSGQQQGSAVTINATGTDFDSTLTVNPGAFTITNQYLFIQIAWERTGAGAMTNADVNWRTGSATTTGTRITTADFTAVSNLTVSVSETVSVADVRRVGLNLGKVVSDSITVTESVTAQKLQPPINLTVRGDIRTIGFFDGPG